jgi:hypothetical protein
MDFKNVYKWKRIYIDLRKDKPIQDFVGQDNVCPWAPASYIKISELEILHRLVF